MTKDRPIKTSIPRNGDQPLAPPISVTFDKSPRAYQGKPGGLKNPCYVCCKPSTLIWNSFSRELGKLSPHPGQTSPQRTPRFHPARPLRGCHISVDTQHPFEEHQSNAFTYPRSMKALDNGFNVENPDNRRILCITWTVTHSSFTRSPQVTGDNQPNALLDQGFVISRGFGPIIIA